MRKCTPNDLTGREIEEIWRKENFDLIEDISKPYIEGKGQPAIYVPKQNQKQFKQFDESLHKAYLNKFSDEDLYKAHNILTALRLERSK